jgi:uncharacterized protein YoxC
MSKKSIEESIDNINRTIDRIEYKLDLIKEDIQFLLDFLNNFKKND